MKETNERKKKFDYLYHIRHSRKDFLYYFQPKPS